MYDAVSAFTVFGASYVYIKSHTKDYTTIFIMIDPRSETGTNGMGTQRKLRSLIA